MAETLRPGDAYLSELLSGFGSYTTSSRPGTVFVEEVVVRTNYLLRGYLYERNPPEYEQWVSQVFPSTSNPSGEPIEDVVLLAVWQSA